MNSEFILSQGAGQKLEFAVRRCGGTREDIDYLSAGENFRAIMLLRTGKAKLVEVTEDSSEDVVISTSITAESKIASAVTDTTGTHSKVVDGCVPDLDREWEDN